MTEIFLKNKIKSGMPIIYIYCLISPVDNNPFYVGACGNPKQRLDSHIQSGFLCGKKGKGNKKDKFISNLLGTGNLPLLKVLYEANEKNVDYYEKFYYNKLMRDGFTLLQSKNSFNYSSVVVNVKKVKKEKSDKIDDFFKRKKLAKEKIVNEKMSQLKTLLCDNGFKVKIRNNNDVVDIIKKPNNCWVIPSKKWYHGGNGIKRGYGLNVFLRKLSLPKLI